MNELKSCPFCGGKAETHECAELENEVARLIYSGQIGVHCTVCRVATLPYPNEKEAIEAWNRRTQNEQR